MSSDRNKATVAEALRALASGDADALLMLLTEDVVWWVAGDLPISGDHDRDAVHKMISGLAGATTGPVTFTAVSVVAEGNRVAVEAESDATLKNGKQYRNRYHMAFEFDGERISRVREYMDTKKVYDLMFG